MIKHCYCFLIMIVVSSSGFAQLDPLYATYLNNPLTINPAYTGSNNMLNAAIQYRVQWASIEASPVTVNVNAHTSIVQNKVGIGIQLIQDKIGDSKNTEFSFLYSYKINLNSSTLSFGMQSGFTRYTNDPSMLTIRDAGDRAFNTFTETQFNTGAGILLKSDKYMLGVSVPRLLPAAVSLDGQKINLYDRTYYVFGSYLFFVSETLRFKPSALLRATQGSPTSVDLNASFTMRERFTAGVFTRNFNTGGLSVQAIISRLRFGYVFEIPFTPSASLNYASHELLVGIALPVLSNHDSVVKTY